MEYLSFFGRRTGQAVLVLLGLSVLMFVLARVVPGDPGRLALGPNAAASQVKALDHDFGTAILTRRNVFDDLRDTFPATLELVLASTLLVVVLGVPLGVLAALNRDGPVDAGARLFALVGVATPDFLVGICLQLIFAYALGILPVSGQLDQNLTFHASITGMVALDSLLVGNWQVFGSAITH